MTEALLYTTTYDFKDVLDWGRDLYGDEIPSLRAELENEADARLRWKHPDIYNQAKRYSTWPKSYWDIKIAGDKIAMFLYLKEDQ